jgi:hypothetical protein
MPKKPQNVPPQQAGTRTRVKELRHMNPKDLTVNPKIILFWSTFNQSIDRSHTEWIDKPIKLSAFHHLPLLAHLKFNHDVDLYTYQNINKSASLIPKGINLKNANDIYSSRKAYRALINGHSIAHISDVVRLKVASVNHGIILDLDAVMLKRFEVSQDSGWFASMPAKLTGGFAPQWKKTHPPLIIHNNGQELWDGRALQAFPIKVNSSIEKIAENLAQRIMVNLANPVSKTSKGWNYILWTLKKAVGVDPNLRVYKPIVFCPVPSWLLSGKCYSLEFPTRLNGKTELFGYKLPSISEIFERSVTVQHFFESAFQNANQVKGDFWKYVQAGSLVGKEAKFILGNDWQSILNESVNNESENKPENLENLSTQHARTRLRVKEFKEMNVKDLVVNPSNWRIHDETQRGAIRSAFDNVGFAGSIIAYESERNNNSIVVIDGHMRIDEIEGDIVPVLLLDVNDEEADILLATYDPLGSMATSDTNMLRDLLDNINNQDNESIKELMNTVDDYYVDLDTVPEDVKQYTQKIETPVYEMKGEYPVTSELYDNGKAERLIAEINNAQLPDDIKKFLILSAYRHTVFDFGNIAEFYSHANAEVQDLMERSALVIIDIDKAVQNGYVQISEEFNKYFGEELDED